jgi:hypothetical protein
MTELERIEVVKSIGKGRGRFFELTMTAHKMLVEGISYERDKTLDIEAIKVRVLSLLKERPLTNKEITGAIIAQASYEKVIEGLKQFRIFLQSILPSYESYYKKFQDIAKDTEKFKAISLGGLLSEGLSILERQVFEDDKCPLCLQDKNRDNLIDEIRKRIEELSSFKKEKEGLEEDHRSTQKTIQFRYKSSCTIRKALGREVQ